MELSFCCGNNLKILGVIFKIFVNLLTLGRTAGAQGRIVSATVLASIITQQSEFFYFFILITRQITAYSLATECAISHKSSEGGEQSVLKLNSLFA